MNLYSCIISTFPSFSCYFCPHLSNLCPPYSLLKRSEEEPDNPHRLFSHACLVHSPKTITPSLIIQSDKKKIDQDRSASLLAVITQQCYPFPPALAFCPRWCADEPLLPIGTLSLRLAHTEAADGQIGSSLPAGAPSQRQDGVLVSARVSFVRLFHRKQEGIHRWNMYGAGSV